MKPFKGSRSASPIITDGSARPSSTLRRGTSMSLRLSRRGTASGSPGSARSPSSPGTWARVGRSLGLLRSKQGQAGDETPQSLEESPIEALPGLPDLPGPAIEDLNQKLADMQKQLAEEQARTHQLQAKLATESSTREKLEHEIGQEVKEKALLHQKLGSELEKGQKLEEKLAAESKKAKQQLLHREDERDKKIQLAHAVAKGIMDKSKTFASSDIEVRDWFNSRSQSWYGWAKDFAHRDPHRLSTMPDAERGEFFDAISQFVVLEHGTPALPAALASQPRILYILLHGLLANLLCSDILGSPFWPLDAINLQREGSYLPAQNNMDNLYRQLVELHPQTAHQWRSSMARLLAINGMGPTRKGLSDDTSAQPLSPTRQRYAAYLTHKFLSGPARVLLRDGLEQSGCVARLCEEIDKALQFSLELFSSRSYVRCASLLTLPADWVYSFRVDNAVLELYQADKIESPENYDDRRIVMMVRPAIIAWGTEDGRDYSAWRVLMKGQVCVDVGDVEGVRESE